MATSELRSEHLRNRLSEPAADVEQAHDRVTITEHGHPAAVLISPDDLASLESRCRLRPARARAMAYRHQEQSDNQGA